MLDSELDNAVGKDPSEYKPLVQTHFQKIHTFGGGGHHWPWAQAATSYLPLQNDLNRCRFWFFAIKPSLLLTQVMHWKGLGLWESVSGRILCLWRWGMLPPANHAEHFGNLLEPKTPLVPLEPILLQFTPKYCLKIIPFQIQPKGPWKPNCTRREWPCFEMLWVPFVSPFCVESHRETISENENSQNI